jgi:membrane protein
MLKTNDHAATGPGTLERSEPASRPTAPTPFHIPLSGWWEVLRHSVERISEDRLLGEAAAVAFYSLLAVLPALAAMTALFDLMADPQLVAGRLQMLTTPLPSGAAEMVSEVLGQVAKHTDGHLGLGCSLAAAALWSAMAAAGQLFGALNVIYKEQERRGFLRLNLHALLFACGAAIFIFLALGGIVAVPVILGLGIGINRGEGQLLLFLRWPALLVAVSIALALVYRFGPSRAYPQWRWVSWGGAAAAVTWLLGSTIVSSYFEYIGSYNWLYGSLGAVLGFMIWAWVSSTAVLFGAALNAEIERWRPPDRP